MLDMCVVLCHTNVETKQITTIDQVDSQIVLIHSFIQALPMSVLVWESKLLELVWKLKRLPTLIIPRVPMWST